MFPYSGDLIELAIRGTVILAIGHLLTQLLYRQSASFRGMLMMLCLLSLLALPLAWVSLPKWEALPQEMTVMPYFPIEMQPVDQSELVKAAEIRQANTSTDAPPQWQWPSRHMVICRVWQIGLILSLCPLVLGWLMLKRVQRQALPVTDEVWHELLSDCMNKLKLSRRVWLMQSDKHTMPMTWGWWRCVILIPSEADTWPEDKCRAMLLHELAHIKRRDCLLAGLSQIACAMHWFNPLAWAALLRLRSLREEACDNIVLGVMDQDKASDYAQHLLDIAANLHSPVLANHASIAMARKSSLENRLLAVLDPRRHRSAITHRVMIGMVTLICLLTIPLVMLRAGEATSSDAQPHTTVNVSTDITPKELFAKVHTAYAALQTYESTGIATMNVESKHGKINQTTNFSIRIKKPDAFRITWSTTNDTTPSLSQEGAAWGDREQPYLYMKATGSYSPTPTIETAIASATGVSGGTAMTIPGMLLPPYTQNPSPFERLQQPTIEPSQTVAGEDCYVVSGSSGISKKETYWIAKRDWLIRQYSRSLETNSFGDALDPANMSDKQLQEAVQAMGLEVNDENQQKVREMLENVRKASNANPIKGILIETHQQIKIPDAEQIDLSYTPPADAKKVDSIFDQIFPVLTNKKNPLPPTTQPSQPIRPKPAKTYTPSRPDWQEQFNKVYRLDDDEVIRFIPKPFIPERMDYYNISNPDQAQLIPEGPDSLTLKWGDEHRKWSSMSFGNGVDKMSEQMYMLTGLLPYDLTGDLTLLNVKLPGDWVFRSKQPTVTLLAALEAIIKKQTDQSITFKPVVMDRQVVVVTGEYQFNAITNTEPEAIHLYQNANALNDEFSFHMGDIDQLLHWVGKNLNIPLINKIDSKVPDPLLWCHHFEHLRGKQGQEREEMLDTVLANLNKQTSLQFTRQQQKMMVWEVSKKD